MPERRRSQTMLALLLLLPATSLAGPREFGRSELARVLAERGLPDTLAAEIRPGGPPDSFDLTPERVIAPDERGLMYGLLAAAEQVRATGRLHPESGRPRTAIRGIRTFLHNEVLEEGWYFSDDYWRAYFAMLARQRFNRFNLVFAHQTGYLAPPYPYWLILPDFPGVRVPALSPERQARNLDRLCRIAAAAADHGIDFTLGIWEHDVPTFLGLGRTVEGLDPATIGPYSRAALRAVLQRCPSIRSVQLRTGDESGIPSDRQVAFYRDHIFPALREAESPVTLDLRGWMMPPGLMGAAEAAGVPLRLSAKYWAEHLGRPYQPAETFPGYSYLDLLRKPHAYGFLWELWALGSHRLLLWGPHGWTGHPVSG
jgi:hypothetical protein